MQLTSNSDKITRDYFDSLLIETRYLDAVLPATEMTAELAGIMARTGVSALDKMDATVIHKRVF